MDSVLVSVCIITYNHEKFIRQCLEGIMKQKTDFSFEVIIGEDCSKDGTRGIIQEFERKYPGIIKAIYHNKNVGAARNAYEFCFPRLTGEFVALCEGDDFWTDENKLQKQVDYLRQNPQHVLCFHGINSVDENDRILDRQRPNDNIVEYTWQEIFHISIPTLSVLYRNVIREIPDEMMKAKSGDTFLFGMLTSFGGAANLGFIAANYRKHGGGIFNSKSLVQQNKQSINTRKLMKQCSYFNREQKIEINKELSFRKRFYIKRFIQKKQLVNCLQIIFS